MTGVSVSPKTSNAKTGAEGSKKLSATVEPGDATNQDVSYTSDLTVTDGGLVSWTAETAAGDYTTTVSAGGFTATHVLTLADPEPEPEPEPEPVE